MEFWGQKIKEFRLSQGWDVQKFADKLGCKPVNVYRIEASENLSEKTIRSIARNLKISVPNLLGYHTMKVEEMAEVYGEELEDTERLFQQFNMVKVIAAQPDDELKGNLYDAIKDTYKKIRKKQRPNIKPETPPSK